MSRLMKMAFICLLFIRLWHNTFFPVICSLFDLQKKKKQKTKTALGTQTTGGVFIGVYWRIGPNPMSNYKSCQVRCTGVYFFCFQLSQNHANEYTHENKLPVARTEIDSDEWIIITRKRQEGDHQWSVIKQSSDQIFRELGHKWKNRFIFFFFNKMWVKYLIVVLCLIFFSGWMDLFIVWLLALGFFSASNIQ